MKRSGQKALLALAALWPAMGHASSEEAWEALRDRLISECQLMGEAAAPKAAVTVTPNEIGSEGFAVALVTTRGEGAGDLPELAVCLMDKRSGAVELSAAFFDLPDLSPTAPD
ncbi:hypothetical protein E4L95_06100 [Paracoccus liaowanqingii]|uniref:Uncharacterized protein n=1 Tax=Paracoccus liaowanqingii TaxID=2560053 RepID=A0A4Z1CQ49_9RHOB|nr:hypothetical protein [Paracoccus liaowanqingii]TGN67139.1 hypothetical protein E4L95_06100 [Paracoccus liaowanqingii]